MADDFKDLKDDFSDLKPAEEVASNQSSFLNNVLDSGTKFVGNLVHAVGSPLETAQTTLDLATGLLGHAIPGFNKNEHADAVAKAFEAHLKERYGGLDAIKHTVYTDPVGFAADLSTVLGGAGGAARVAGEVGGVSKLAKAGELVGAASEATNPLNIVKGAGKAADAVGLSKTAQILQHPITAAEPLAKRLYRASLKPSGNTTEATAKVNTALQEGLMPTDESGMWKRIMGYSGKVDERLNDPRAADLTVDPTDVRQRIGDTLLSKYEQGGKPGESAAVQSIPTDDKARVESQIQKFTNEHFNPATPGTPDIPSELTDSSGQPLGITKGIPATPETPIMVALKKAQALKQGDYNILSQKDFGRTSGAGAAEPQPVFSKQAVLESARGWREGIGQQLGSVGINDIHDINRAEGNVLNLKPDIEKAAARAASRSIVNPKGAIMEHALPRTALMLYKAGKLDYHTLSAIMKQAETAGASLSANTE